MVSCLYLYLFSVRSSKVFYVQLIFVKRWQLKNIKNCNIEVDQMHQLLKTKKIRYSLWATLQFVRIEKLILRLCGSVIEHRNAESEGLRFDSSRGLGIYSLSHARDKTKNIYLQFYISFSFAINLHLVYPEPSFSFLVLSLPRLCYPLSVNLYFVVNFELKEGVKSAKYDKLFQGLIVPYYAIYTILFT